MMTLIGTYFDRTSKRYVLLVRMDVEGRQRLLHVGAFVNTEDADAVARLFTSRMA